MRTKARPTIVALLCLTAMWVLLWGELTWGNVIGGLLVALFVTIVVPVPQLNLGGLRIRLWPVLKLAATFMVDFTRSSVQVAWLAIRRTPAPPGAIVHVPMAVREDFTLATAITMLNLQPGGIVVEINKPRQTLTMHLIDGSSTGAVEAALRQFERMRLQLIDALEGGNDD